MTPLNKNSLLQWKRFEVETLKSRLVALDEMNLGLNENIRQLNQAADRERIRGGNSAMARLAMPQILQAMDERRKNIEKTRAELEQDRNSLETQLAAAEEKLAAAELADDRRRRRAAKAVEAMAEFRREQNLMPHHLRRHAAARD